MNKYSNQKAKQTKKVFKMLFMAFLISSISIFSNNTIDSNNLAQETEKTASKKIKIKEAFSLISKKTSFHFFFNNNLNDLDKKVILESNNSDIKITLNKLLKTTNLEYKIDGNEILIREKIIINKKIKNVATIKRAIQENIIKGVVFDDTNMPLPGVNVKVIGKSSGTTTDFDGNFSLTAKPEDTLEFSYMGFKTQTIKVNQKTSFNIIMQGSANTLDEVIISGVAAGTSKKKMSVSVAKIKSEDLNMVPQSSVSSSLSGKLAGVTITSLNGSPGSGSSITLRGATSLTGSQSPMILVDGVIMTGSLSDINVDDVESIEVVKGAAASALYGSKAGNGVVVITSKRGRKLKQDKLSITFRSRYEMQKIAKYLDLSESHAYELSPNWLDATNYTNYNGVNYPTNYTTGWNSSISGDRLQKYDGYMDLPYRVNNNLQDALFTNGANYTNYIAAGYKTGKTNIFLSFEDSKDEGIVIETKGYHRNSLRANIDHQILPKLKLSASNSFIKTSYNRTGSGTGIFSKILEMEPDVDLFKANEDGQKYNYFPNHWNTRVSNPLYNLWRIDDDSNKLRFLGNYKLKYTINDQFNAEVSYAVESQNYNRKKNTPKETFVGFNNSDNTLNQSYGSHSLYLSRSLNQYFRATLNYSKSWSDLDFKGKLSYLFEDNRFDSEDNKYANAADPIDNSYKYYDFQTDIKSVNYFAIGSLVYKDRYIFDALFRYDGSSLFGENQRWHPYYRVSAAYRITKDFPINGVEELKLRAAYGTSGQRPAFSAQYETFKELEDGSLIKDQLGNKDLRPSNSAEIEIGLDISFLNRFTFETTYSSTKTTDEVIRFPLAAPLGGFVSQVGNVGTLVTKTLEASLQSKIIKTEDLKWNLGITLDKTTSKITQLDIPAFNTGPLGAFKIENNGEYGDMYGYSLVTSLSQMKNQLPSGDSISNYMVNSDGIVVKTSDVGTVNEKSYVLLNSDGSENVGKIGSVAPNFRMGFNTNVSYKNFSFYMLWKWKNGGEIYNYTAQRLVQAYRHPMMDQRWTKPEDKKTVQYYQTLYNRSRLTDFWVEDASYVKLNEASIYYNFKPKKYFTNVKFGITGKNLYTFTDYTGYDPEAGYNGYVFDNYGYPNFRSFAASLELKF